MADMEAIREKVTFDLALKRVTGDYASISSLSFKGIALGNHPEWIAQLCTALTTNHTCNQLDLSDTSMSDEALQKIAITLFSPDCAAQLKVLDLRSNPFSLA